MDANPWLQIPIEDYERHMSAVGQSALLRKTFARVYAERRPRRLAVLGCTSGIDLQNVDVRLTETVVGVDINPRYLEAARLRLGALGQRLHLVQGDVLEVELPPVEFDLVHVALLLEYVDPRRLFARVRRWLAPDGVCSVVTQEPNPSISPVSKTAYASLELLADRMVLRTASEVAKIAETAGLHLLDQRPFRLPTGKAFAHSTFASTDEVPRIT
jgi:ubiquinone/menaquinone biosynthesis C-methylase UbiE